MEELFSGLNHWHWWSIALGLLILEMLLPGTFFMWLGISAGVVGLLLLLFPSMGWEWQVFFFAIFSIVSLFVWFRYLKKHPQQSDQPTLNRRGQQYVGRTFTLNEPISNGTGKLKVDDTTWRVVGEDATAGDTVRVVGVDGVNLRVEKAEH